MDESDLRLLRPLRNGIVAERLKPIPRLIILTDADPEDHFRVVQVGPGKRDERHRLFPTVVKPGDLIRVPGIAKSLPDYEEGKLVLITEDDVAGIEVES